MDIKILNDAIPLSLPAKTKEANADNIATSFGQVLKEKLEEVNQLQVEADKLTQKFLVGDPVELHQVLIATEQANLALQLTMQIRNKIIEAYQELSRMPL